MNGIRPATTMQTLISLLTTSGVGSRRRCFDLLAKGKVLVNGNEENRPSYPVDSVVDVVKVSGRSLHPVDRKVYLKMNKPTGIISTTSDERGRTTVIDLVPAGYRHLRLFPVGRLDINTTGLILLTNDGDLANRLMHPRYEVEKEYHALLNEPLTSPQQQTLKNGVTINGARLVATFVRRLTTIEGFWYSIVVNEGKKHQVRLMFFAVHRLVRSLQRVRIHSLNMGSLPLGAVEELSTKELDSLLGAT